MPALAKLDLGLAADRGPDVVHQVSLPASWLEQGASIECELPRKLRCAPCDGGGCDACERSGAIAMYEPGQAPRRVVVHLSPGSRTPRSVRLLEQGGTGTDPARPRGCLMLRLEPGRTSSGVRLEGVLAPSGARIPVLLGLAVALAVVLYLWV
jgi:hypothetical protein